MIFYIDNNNYQDVKLTSSSSNFKQNSRFYNFRNKINTSIIPSLPLEYEEPVDQFFINQDLFCSSSQLVQLQDTILESPPDEENSLELDIESILES